MMHSSDCLAVGESDLDYSIRMTNFGPCPCEFREATQIEAEANRRKADLQAITWRGVCRAERRGVR